MQKENRQCKNCKNQFTIEPDDFNFYTTIKVPPPTWCPQCRLIRRMSWQMYRVMMLYKRPCDFTGEQVITPLNPAIQHKVYRQDIWWSDKWDAGKYGRDYDFSKNFFSQFKELFDAVPLPALYTEYTTMVNSDYCNAAGTLKNCYLCFKADHSEDCAYLNAIQRMKDCIDVAYSNNCELTYDSVNVNKCFRTFFSEDCEDSHDIWFSRDLVGCQNCIGCTNLRSKSYHIFNEPYSKEEYESKFKEFDFGSLKNTEEFRKKAREFFLKYPRKEFHGRKNIDSSGDYISNCKNVKDSYMVRNGENVRYAQLLKDGPVAQAYDYTMFADKAEWIYESAWTGISVMNIKFGVWNYHANDLEYCFGCHGSSNMFGCVGMRNKEYCILNKQYSKDEYQSLVPRIKEHMMQLVYRDRIGREYRYGELFPSELNPVPYNEGGAYDFFPLSKEEAIKRGFSWFEPDVREYVAATISPPDHIKDATDELLAGVLKCEACGKNYKLIEKELAFYRRFELPIPRRCPMCRDNARIHLLNPMILYERTCAKCGKEIKTSYAPDRSEIVYCEQCYQAEVV